MFKSPYHYAIFFGVHLAVGVLASFSTTFAFVWGLIPITFGLADVIISKNRNGIAGCWAAYATGAEVVLRMQEASVTFESAKYYMIILLITGLLVGRSFKKGALIFIFLLALLLPAAFLTDLTGDVYRKAILFNLSGPFTLIAACLYFYDRPVTKEELNSILVYFVMPIVSTVIVLQFNTPDFSSIKFNAESNFETSGGFGPNQVSSIMGCGAFIILIAIILKMKITGFRVIDLLLLAIFTFRGIITFSRGGIISVFIAIALLVIFAYLFNHPIKSHFGRYLLLIIPASLLIWSYAIDITGGQIENRYFGRNARGKEQSNLTSGRSNIVSADYALFLENPALGVGVGMSKILRERRYGFLAASHSEVSRLLAEHGILGVLFLVLFIGIIIQKWIRSQSLDRIWIITMITYGFLTVNHAAMRIAMPGFILGFAFIYLMPSNSKKK